MKVIYFYFGKYILSKWRSSQLYTQLKQLRKKETIKMLSWLILPLFRVVSQCLLYKGYNFSNFDWCNLGTPENLRVTMNLVKRQTTMIKAAASWAARKGTYPLKWQPSKLFLVVDMLGQMSYHPLTAGELDPGSSSQGSSPTRSCIVFLGKTLNLIEVPPFTH